MKTRRALGAVALAAVLCAGAGAAPQAAWREFRSAEGRFAVSLPGEPKEETRSTPTDLGPIEMRLLSAQTEGLYCSVIYYDIPGGAKAIPDVRQLLEATCDGFIEGAGLVEKVERKEIAIDGNPGIEVRGEEKDGSAVLLARYYLVKDRIYLVLAGAAPEDVASPEVGRYLASFRLL